VAAYCDMGSKTVAAAVPCILVVDCLTSEVAGAHTPVAEDCHFDVVAGAHSPLEVPVDEVEPRIASEVLVDVEELRIVSAVPVALEVLQTVLEVG
jgi:hypothetical protein